MALKEINVAPIRRMRLMDEASRVIRDMILTGKLPAGTRLRQEGLARKLGISRTPLREALMRLEQEGLITMLPQGGLRVVALDAEGAVELYDIREVLDGLAARLSALRNDGKWLRSLERHLVKMEKSINSQSAHSWFVHHTGFHEGIFRMSGNSRILGLTSNVQLSIQSFHQQLLKTPNRLAIAFEEHLGIYDAIRSGDPDLAERLARLHITNAKEIVLAVLHEQEKTKPARVG